MKTRLPLFMRGFTSAMSLWLAGAPVALAYVAVARSAGLNALEIQLMSLMIYSAATQIALAQLLSAGGSALTLPFTIIVINLHHFLYGLSLSKRIQLSRFGRMTAPFFLTDSVYGLTIAERRNENFAFLFGAELSLFLGWNLFTGLGILFGNGLAHLKGAYLDFVAPLTFFVLLISMLKTRLDVAMAVFAVALAGFCLFAGVGSLAVIIVGITTPLVGVVVSEFQKRKRSLS